MTQNYAQAWNYLKEQVSKVQDPILRNVMMAEFRKKAIKDWGFDPETGNLPTHTDDLGLTDWEKEFVDDIECSIKFGVDMRAGKRQQTDSDCRASMMQFVRDGGTLNDIPEHIRCESIDKIYRECRDKYHKEMMELADYGVKL